uniref:Uncharacterized protein n=1 Tax=Knipowitschia caucasica TaxID=637954 RepID=A0AAV2M3D3_KNICA
MPCPPGLLLPAAPPACTQSLAWDTAPHSLPPALLCPLGLLFLPVLSLYCVLLSPSSLPSPACLVPLVCCLPCLCPSPAAFNLLCLLLPCPAPLFLPLLTCCCLLLLPGCHPSPWVCSYCSPALPSSPLASALGCILCLLSAWLLCPAPSPDSASCSLWALPGCAHSWFAYALVRCHELLSFCLAPVPAPCADNHHTTYDLGATTGVSLLS